MTETITLQVPETIYRRLVDTARATKRPLEDIMLRVLEIGSPPLWTDVPEEFQADLAALDKMEDEALWKIAYSQMPEEAADRATELLEFSDRALTPSEQQELIDLQAESNRFMLCKAQASAILGWRGHRVPQPQ
ncbi:MULTISPECIES: hypothetical protein [Spirulina sp. CCY15215]|uniref:hypothetical protein n=1 Tax=Spirulina sp. CCY15215 TaxID=2767591 RepID=UPI001950CBFB|nr:hypothetical protein [Spirulina major]